MKMIVFSKRALTLEADHPWSGYLFAVILYNNLPWCPGSQIQYDKNSNISRVDGV